MCGGDILGAMTTQLPPTVPNGDTIRELERAGYDRVAATYSLLTRIGLAEYRRAFLARTAIEPGHAILDVCCGPGWLTLESVALAGPSGRAVGVDISPGMIAAARANAVELGVGNATFEVMDAESLALPDASFDWALCSFGLMHVPDAERAASEMARVLRPSGRLVMTVWGTAEETPYLGLLADSLREVAGDRVPVDLAYFLRLGGPGVVDGLLARAGFDGVAVEPVKNSIAYPGVTDGEAYFDAVVLIGGMFSSLIRQLPTELVQQIRAAFARRVARYKVGDLLSVPAGLQLVTARRPPAG